MLMRGEGNAMMCGNIDVMIGETMVGSGIMMGMKCSHDEMLMMKYLKLKLGESNFNIHLDYNHNIGFDDGGYINIEQ